MNNDILGLIKYILLIMAVSLLQLLDGVLFLLLSISSNALSNETFYTLFVLFLTVPFIYILSGILITRFAIKNHWSKYLDGFFSNRKLITLIFFLSILIIYFYYILDNWIWNYLLFCFAPTYIIIYVTVMYIIIKKKYYK